MTDAGIYYSLTPAGTGTYGSTVQYTYPRLGTFPPYVLKHTAFPSYHPP